MKETSFCEFATRVAAVGAAISTARKDASDPAHASANEVMSDFGEAVGPRPGADAEAFYAGYVAGTHATLLGLVLENRFLARFICDEFVIRMAGCASVCCLDASKAKESASKPVTKTAKKK